MRSTISLFAVCLVLTLSVVGCEGTGDDPADHQDRTAETRQQAATADECLGNAAGKRDTCIEGCLTRGGFIEHCNCICGNLYVSLCRTCGVPKCPLPTQCLDP